MEQQMTGITYKIKEMAQRIRELREITGLTVEEMASRTGLTVEEYEQHEAGNRNLSIAFLYRCTLSFYAKKEPILMKSCLNIWS